MERTIKENGKSQWSGTIGFAEVESISFWLATVNEGIMMGFYLFVAVIPHVNV